MIAMIKNYKLAFFILTYVLLLAFVYYPALHVGFYLDDFDSITNNPVIQNPSWEALNKWYPMRQLGYATLVFDYQVWGDNSFGFHLTNIVLHFLTVLAVYWLASLVLSASRLDTSKYWMFPALAALLFLILPLNSQAVIYTIQRLAILAALFYVLGLACYIKVRLVSDTRRYLWLILTVLCFLAGMHVKQNVATFPAAIFVVEVLLFNSVIRRNAAAIFTGTLLIALLLQVADFALGSGLFEQIDRYTRETTDITRWQYLTHQFYVHWLYIGKFFFPHPLRLEYSLSLFNWSNFQVWLGFLATLLTLLLAWKLRRNHAVIALAAFLYFLLHAVESGLVPIRDLVFEHRAYLPNVMMCLLIAYLLCIGLVRVPRVAITVFVVFLIGNGIVTHSRATLWQEPIEFYRNEMVYEGESSRLYSSLAAKFAEKGDTVNAFKWFRIAMKVGEDTGVLHANTVVSYIDLLNQRGEEGRAKSLGIKALKVARRYQDKADILVVMAKLDVAQGQCDFAMGMINRALRYHPLNVKANYLKKMCEEQLKNQQ